MLIQSGLEDPPAVIHNLLIKYGEEPVTVLNTSVILKLFISRPIYVHYEQILPGLGGTLEG